MKETYVRIFSILKSKKVICAGLISLVQTLLSVLTDRFIFTQDARNGLKYLFFKFLFFFVLFTVWYFIIHFLKKLFIEKNKKLMIYFESFLFFFIFYSIIFVLIYPGNWMWNDLDILTAATELGLSGWQHILTSIFYIFSLMVFPLPISVVIVQYTTISVIIAYFIGTLYNRGGRKYLLSGILFLLPPVLIHVFYPMRLCLFAFLELLFFFIINEQKKLAGYKVIILVVALNILLAVWRTECRFLIVFFLIYLIYKKYSLKMTAIVTATMIVISGMLIAANNYCLDEVQYTVTGLVRPFHVLLLEEFKQNDSELIREIDDIVDVENAPLYDDGERAYWADIYKGVDTKHKLKRMEYVLWELAKKYPQVLLKERWNTFHASEKVLDKDGNICMDNSIYWDTGYAGKIFSSFAKSSPINADLRAKVLLVLYAKSGTIIDYITKYLCNLVLPIVLLILLLIHSIMRKDIMMLLSSLFLLAQAAIVFVTAPLSLFLYYFPIYMCSYGLFITKFQSIFAKLYKSIKKGCHI